MTVTDQPAGRNVSPSQDEFLVAQASPEFARLRTTLRRFVFPMSVFFLLWYAVYVMLGAFAHDFMGTPVWGNINVGLILGLLQFVTTFGITFWYVRFANHDLDPKAEEIRQQFQRGEYRPAEGGLR